LRSVLIAAAASLAIVPAAQAGPLTPYVIPSFDNLPASPTTPVPTSYGGATWDGTTYAVNNGWYNTAYGNTIGFPSSENAAFNGPAAPGQGTNVATITLTFSQAITSFTAQYATWAFANAQTAHSAKSLTITGLNGSTADISQDITLDTHGQFTSYTVNFASAVNQVTITTDQGIGTWFLIDVPEPASFGLLGVSLVAFGLLRRRRPA
jgi:hypothetical protein